MDTSSVRCADQPNTEPLENRSLWARLQVSCSRPTLPACLLLALVFLAYLPALDAGFVFDDGMYLTENARMGSAEGLRRIWTEVIGGSYQHQYYPLTSSAFWLQHQLWGERPLGYHLVNVLLHAANAVLLWRLLRRLGVPGSWLVAAIFGVHPLNVQSVAWISELKNVLSTLFLLFSALVFVDWLRLDQQHEQEPSAVRRPDPHLLSGPPGREPTLPLKGGGLYALGLGLFVCALLSKTATCLLPVGLALVVWWKRGGMRRREVLGLGPLVLVGASFVAMTVYLESSYAGASGEAFSQTFLERFLVAGRAVWFYAGKLLWPGSLAVIYPRPGGPTGNVERGKGLRAVRNRSQR